MNKFLPTYHTLFFNLIAVTIVITSTTRCSPKITQVDLPFDTLQSFSLSGDTDVPEEWWLSFNDKELNALIETALNSNRSLISVWYQLKEAGAFVDIAGSERWPQIFLELQSGISRPEPDFVGGETTQLSLRADYEVDLWGRIRHSVNAEKFRFQASYYDYKTAAISLSGEIAITWFRLKATINQIQLIDAQMETNEQVLGLIRARFASGQVRGVDILRQEQLIENNKEQRIDLELELEILENQLSVLLGQPPGEEFEFSSELPSLPPLPDTGIPLQLVNRRPDVLSAFYSLQASDKEVAAAISNKYPRLNFSLNGAVRSNSLTGLFESQAVSLSSSILAPLFYGGRLNAQVDRARAVRQQLLSDYGQTLLIAFQEIENALIRETKLQEQIVVLEEQISLSERTYGQLRIEYLNGSIPYLDVLVTLDQQLQLRQDLVSTRLDLLESRIALYRALAGGFDTGRENLVE